MPTIATRACPVRPTSTNCRLASCNAHENAKCLFTQATQQVQRPTHAAPAWHAPATLALAAAASLSLVATPVHAVSGGKSISSSLAFSDQSGADFRGAQLTKADLRGARFVGADLSNANLFGALAEGADFSSANLSGADLEG